jgi:hypothetical protein
MNVKFVISMIILSIGLFSSVAEARHPRSEAAKDHFKESSPCPANGARHGACPGYVIDHIKPLDCGGADDPSNMQWQSVAEGKAKDKWERQGCHGGGSPATAEPIRYSPPAAAPGSASEGLKIIKWTDENGKVHFGERPANAVDEIAKKATVLPYDNSDGILRYEWGYSGRGISFDTDQGRGSAVSGNGNLYTGPRGGQYTLTSGGNKRYIGGGRRH